MTDIIEILVNKENFRDTKIIGSSLPPLEWGQIRVAIDKYGLTSNNVSYAVSGDMIGYWKFYPAESPYGKVPVWGMADVIESNSEDIEVGERIWGFFPMSSHATLTVGKIRDDSFMEATPHRRDLPGLYNQYRRTKGETDMMRALEDERCLLFPLFATSFVICDYLLDNEIFGAEQIIIGSVSSKTGFGLAKLLHDDENVGAKVVGITSSGNADFVSRIKCCDEVVTYGDESSINANLPTAFIDMAGNGPLTEKLHQHFGENLVKSSMVGVTHWEKGREVSEDLPGTKPELFFTPAQVAKRDQEWGRGVLFGKASMASAKIAQDIKGEITVERIVGAEKAAAIWKDMLDNKVSAHRGIMASVS